MLKTILLQATLFLAIGLLKAQTTLIDPAGAGSFALGNTFESNGWTVVNSDNVNGWAIGPSSGVSRAAFASSNWQDATPLPGIGVTNIVKTFHFYRDITLPANEPVVELNFKCRMTFGLLYVGIAPTSFVPGVSDIGVPINLGGSISRISFSPQWSTISANILPLSLKDTTVRLIFTGYYTPNSVSPAQAIGPSVYDISLTSRPSISFQSKPGTYQWTDPNAWVPKGVPLIMDDATIVPGSTISGGSSLSTLSINNLTIHGTLNSYISFIGGNLIVKSNGLLDQKITSLNCGGNFIVEDGGNVKLSQVSLGFSSHSLTSPVQQVLSFHSPQQFESGAIRELIVNNPAGLRIQSTQGRLVVGTKLSMLMGTLVTNDALEVNHQAYSSSTYTLITFNRLGTWTTPVHRATGSRIGLFYNGDQGTPESPYIMGSRGEWSANDTLYEFVIGAYDCNIKSLEDVKVAVKDPSRFRLFGTLQMAPDKSVIMTESDFLGATPNGFPGSAIFNIYNDAHVSGGAGIAFRLNGTNLNRVWPVGVDGKQLVLGMYGINASNALVRVSAIRSEEGQAGAGISSIHPLYRYKVEVLEGTLEKVDSVNLGFNAAVSDFVESDQNNRRVTASNTLNGTYENMGGTASGVVVASVFRPEWNFGWVRSNTGNYNGTSYYALGLSTGKFAIMWRNNSGGSFLWDDPANWTGNVVPTINDAVIINAPGTTITVSNNSACKQLTITKGTNFVVPPGVTFKVGG